MIKILVTGAKMTLEAAGAVALLQARLPRTDSSCTHHTSLCHGGERGAFLLLFLYNASVSQGGEAAGWGGDLPKDKKFRSQ